MEYIFGRISLKLTYLSLILKKNDKLIKNAKKEEEKIKKSKFYNPNRIEEFYFKKSL